ncbi:MAG: dTMP kinase [Betaproteobacteria bacterium]|nr:dTMP kinase [Betaproteobacteria bacterium]
MNRLFISVEGIDGAGKSSHIDAMAAALRAAGYRVCVTREPGGTPLAEQLREMVLHTPMDALTESLLIFAARRDHITRVIQPALARGDVVLCDRFTDATFAYQGGGHGFDLDVLGTLERWVQTQQGRDGQAGGVLLQPGLTLWFDLPAQVAAQRLAGARVPDKFEAQPQAFFEKVIAGYARRAALDPQRFARIQADQTPDAVRAEVLAALRTHGLLPA